MSTDNCASNCNTCDHKEFHDSKEEGHCYMFRMPPPGQCGQYKMSKRAKQDLFGANRNKLIQAALVD